MIASTSVLSLSQYPLSICWLIMVRATLGSGVLLAAGRGVLLAAGGEVLLAAGGGVLKD